MKVFSDESMYIPLLLFETTLFTRVYVFIDEERIDRAKLEDSLSGLIALGFKRNVAYELINSIKDEISPKDRAEDIIKKALKKHG